MGLEIFRLRNISADTKVEESMLAMRVRVTSNLSFGVSCGPIEALRGDFDPPRSVWIVSDCN